MDIAKSKSSSPASRLAAALHRSGTNHLLSLLPRHDRERIIGRCERLALNIEHVLYEPGGTITHVYFPLSGMVSMVIESADGDSIEVGAVGNEGVVGTALALGAKTSPWKALIQLKGEFLRLPVREFLSELKRSPALADLSSRFAQALTIQIAQSVMCNRLHPVEMRICRWLLISHDRAGTDVMQLTQQFVAEMLGVRRPSVTVAAGMLQKAGFVRYQRGKVTVLDRAGLERTACGCYAAVNRELANLMRRGPARS